MKSPFIFGKIAKDQAFINRGTEIKRLSSNFENNVNTILISPRRWGKSSLVYKTTKSVVADNSKTKFCFLDMFKIRSEEELYKVYATEIIKATSGKIEEWVSDVKNFLGRLSPNISFGIDPINDFQLSFNFNSPEIDKEEILNLPEKIAKKKDINIVICIDEFQNIGKYSESKEIQQLLRSVWQYHQHSSYCLYGSKRHMMIELFENQSMPFYKFGDIMFIHKIAKEHFIEFICKSFSHTRKSISKTLAERIINTVDNHPYFIQQLAHIVWVNTAKKTTKKILEDSIEELIDQYEILFQEIVRGLSNKQLNFLIALSNGENNLNSVNTMQKYALGTSGNVTKNKKVLLEKEVILNEGGLTFQDPMFRLWLLRMF